MRSSERVRKSSAPPVESCTPLKGSVPPVASGEPPASGTRAWARASQNLVKQGTELAGSFEVYLPTADLCVVRGTGHFSLALARLLPEALAPRFAEGKRCSVMCDLEEMTNYDTASRRMLTSWVLANARMLQSFEFLIRSQLVAMAVAAANLATMRVGVRLISHTDRAAFEKALERVL